MEAIDDDFFSDDGFDDLPPDALQQLEHDAFRATQAEPSQPPQPPQPEQRRNWNSRDNSNWYPKNDPVNAANATLQPPANLHTGLTNDYGALDVGELDAEVFDDGPSSAVALEDTIVPQNQGLHSVHDTIVLDDEEPRTEGGPSFFNALHTEHQLLSEKLQQENERYSRMESELATAKSMAETKAGEIAIIRSNQAKINSDYERKLATLRKTMEEEMARYREEVEAIREQGKSLATENAFLKQDLAEEVARMHQIKAKTRAEEKSAPLTPKKTKVLPFRDGFNDEEILAISPSKSGRSKQATPTVIGKKRRRTSQGSPTPLQLNPRGDITEVEAIGDAMDDSLDDAMTDVAVEPVIVKEVPKVEVHRDTNVMKRILSHCTLPPKTDIEVMAELAFPSEPGRSLYSLLLEETTKLDFHNYAKEHLLAMIVLWSRSLEENYYQAIEIFLETTRFILVIDKMSVLSLIDQLIPVLVDTGDVNGVPRFRHSPYSRQSFGQITQTPASELEPLVDSTEVLGLLYEIACRALSDDQILENLWRHIRYSLVLMMLSCSQPANEIKLVLSLLITSVRGNSFASIRETEQEQIDNEKWTIDRVASLLWETLQPDEGQPPYTRSEICDVRLEALAFLEAITFNPVEPKSTHGSLVIASHPTVLAKLIRAMHDELDALYSFPPERHMHSAMVNGLMRLVYSIIQRHPQEAELQPKLHRVPGGKQKFLVVLTRLAFSEGLVLEAGIDDETVEMAHSILDDAVNPEEAEALLDAFPHAKWEDEAGKDTENNEETETDKGKDTEMQD
ncbi:hypothetical protein BDV18DRAFT_28261 [Aspergillus unguis]